jgi:type I restriction enzyme S subunit
MRREDVLPEEWSWQSLGVIAEKVQDGTHFSPKSTTGPYRYLTSRNIRSGYIDLNDSGWISEREHRSIYQRCDPRRGDLLLTKDGANTGNATLNTLDEEFSLLSSVTMLRFDSRHQSPSFFLQYLLSPRGQTRLKDLMSGNAITRLTLAKIKHLTVPVPPTTEQRRIAGILDTVDVEIRSTERLIAKLELMQQGLLHNLIQRPLDEDRTHLGRPESVVQLGDVLDEIEAGWTPPSEDVTPGTGQWGVLKVSAVSSGAYEPSEAKRLANGVWPRAELEVKPRDVLLARANGVTDLVATVAEVHATPPRLTISDKTLRLIPNRRKITGSFLVLSLKSASSRRQVRGLLNGSSGQQNISQQQIRRIRIGLPPLAEQAQIVDVNRALDARLTADRRHLGKLRLLKQGLMDDLLTGRARVTVDEGAA